MSQYYPVPSYPHMQYPAHPEYSAYAGHYPAPAGYYASYPGYHGNYLEQGKFGAVVGLCGAGAVNLRRYLQAEVSGGEAMVNTLKTGLYAGLATAAAGMVASRFRSPSLSLVATVATGTAVMYALTSEPRRSGHD